jgi:hypothetical protein
MSASARRRVVATLLAGVAVVAPVLAAVAAEPSPANRRAPLCSEIHGTARRFAVVSVPCATVPMSLVPEFRDVHERHEWQLSIDRLGSHRGGRLAG